MWDKRSNTSPVTIYNGQKVSTEYTARYSVANENLISRLTISQVILDDAGTFECLNKASGTVQMVYTLIVLDRNPQCDITREQCPEIITASCSVCYAGIGLGIEMPAFACFTADATTEFTPDTVDTRNSCMRYTSHLNRRVNRGSIFNCRFTLVEDDQVRYTYDWTSCPMNMIYGPESVTIHNWNKTVYASGDQLSCSADSNPESTFHWLIGNTTRHGPTFLFNVCELIGTDDGTDSDEVARVLSNSWWELICIARRGDRAATASTHVQLSVSPAGVDNCGAALPQSQHPNIAYVLAFGSVVAVLVILVIVLQIRYMRYESLTDKLYVRPLPRREPSSAATTLNRLPPGVYDELENRSSLADATTSTNNDGESSGDGGNTGLTS